MNASTLLKVGLMSGTICSVWGKPLAAATDCVSTLRIEAPEQTERQLRSRLRSGRLSTVSAEHCRDADVYLEKKDGIWQLQFTQGNSSILRSVKSPEIAAVWVESWLMPTTFLEVAESGSEPTVEAPPPLPDKTVPEVTAPFAFAAEGGLGMAAALGSLWLGPELRLHHSVGSQFWLEPRIGWANAITNRPEQASRMLRVSTAINREVFRISNTGMSVGFDLGLTSILWRDRRLAKHLTGPHLGARFSGIHRLSRRFSVVARAEAALVLADRVDTQRKRVYFDNDGDDAERVDLVTSEQRLTPAWVGTFELGLIVHWGDQS